MVFAFQLFSETNIKWENETAVWENGYDVFGYAEKHQGDAETKKPVVNRQPPSNQGNEPPCDDHVYLFKSLVGNG